MVDKLDPVHGRTVFATERVVTLQGESHAAAGLLVEIYDPNLPYRNPCYPKVGIHRLFEEACTASPYR